MNNKLEEFRKNQVTTKEQIQECGLLDACDLAEMNQLIMEQIGAQIETYDAIMLSADSLFSETKSFFKR